VAPKDEKTVAIAKVGDGFAQAKKDETLSSKTAADVMPTAKWTEEKISNSGGAVAFPGTHGVVAMPGNVAAAVAEKSHANTTGVALAGQHGTDVEAASITDGHRMLEATPTTLEVGVSNGTHGWLKIRAEMADGGVVNASVSAATTAGQEMLHRELPSLTAYLHEEQISVGSVAVHTTSAAGSREFGGTESDAGREQMQQRQEGESKRGAMGTALADSGDAYFQGGSSGTTEMATHVIYTGGGSWLSVRA
jgi:hypothetical protein